VTLPGEETTSVSVFDTCDEVRKKIRALLFRDGVPQAASLPEISKIYKYKKVSAANLRYFLGKKGPLDGNPNALFMPHTYFLRSNVSKQGNPKASFGRKWNLSVASVVWTLSTIRMDLSLSCVERRCFWTGMTSFTLLELARIWLASILSHKENKLDENNKILTEAVVAIF
jgi:hypothetical protein